MPASSSRHRAADTGRAADEALLARRLEELGLNGFRGVTVHENRTVLVSVTGNGTLRVHRGYAYASDRVLSAILAFAGRRTNSRERARAEQIVVSFPVDRYVEARPSRSRPRNRRTEDRPLLSRLRRLHRRLNERHFAGKLWNGVPLRISHRMRTRLAELTVDERKGRPAEIAISRIHIERDGWSEVEHTLLHEMIHQWQVESGLEADHGETFRRKAIELGVLPTAQREVLSQRFEARREQPEGEEQ
ncbi:MAG: SprT-like domain-containing protein [Gemmatimonadales bacterium]